MPSKRNPPKRNQKRARDTNELEVVVIERAHAATELTPERRAALRWFYAAVCDELARDDTDVEEKRP